MAITDIKFLSFSEGIEVSAPELAVSTVYSLQVFSDDASFVADKGAAAEEGDIYYNSTNLAIRFYNGIEWTDISVAVNKYDATVDPTVNDDETSGYGPGSQWYNTTDSTLFICLDGTTGAADWFEVTAVDATQTFTNKTIDADNNTISNLEHGAEVDNPTSGVHGVTGDVVGTSDTQELTNKTIDADNNTISNLEHGAEVDNPISGVHGVTGDVVGTSDTQELTNKKLTGGTASADNQWTLPSNTKTNLDGLTRAAGALYYDSTNSQYWGDDGTNLVEIGGSGGGLEVFFSDDFEVNLDNVGTPVDVSGNDTLSTAANTSTPLVGDTSLRISKSAADGSGDYLDIGSFSTNADFPVTIFTVKFFASTSENYKDEDLKILAHDGTDEIVIQPEELLAGSGYFIGTFQSTSGAGTYSVRFKVNSDNGSAWDVDVDNLEVAKTEITHGAVVTEWETWTPTGSLNNNVSYYGRKRRVGDTGEYEVELLFNGTNTEGNIYFDMPEGEIIDTSKINRLAAPSVFGVGGLRDADNVGFIPLYALPVGGINDRVYIYYTTEGSLDFDYGLNLDTSTNSPIEFADGDRIILKFSVPIVGWGAQAQLGTDVGLRDVVFSGRVLSQTLNSATYDQIEIDDIFVDTASAWNSSTYEYEIPETAEYDISMLSQGNDIANGKFIYNRVEVDGTTLELTKSRNNTGGAWDLENLLFRGSYPLKKGQVIDFQIYTNETTNLDVTTNVSIKKIGSTKQIFHEPDHGKAPVGSIIAYMPGYFGNGSNGSFSDVLGNSVAEANAKLNPYWWHVCDGSELNDPSSRIFNGSGRYLPNLTDDRFLMGDTGVGSSGGSNVMLDHTHTHTISATQDAHTHIQNSHNHTQVAHSHNLIYDRALSAAQTTGGGRLASTSGVLGRRTTVDDTIEEIIYSSATNEPITKTAATNSATTATNQNAQPSITISGGVGTGLAASSTENRPKYLSCLYIMRIK